MSYDDDDKLMEERSFGVSGDDDLDPLEGDITDHDFGFDEEEGEVEKDR